MQYCLLWKVLRTSEICIFVWTVWTVIGICTLSDITESKIRIWRQSGFESIPSALMRIMFQLGHSVRGDWWFRYRAQRSNIRWNEKKLKLCLSDVAYSYTTTILRFQHFLILSETDKSLVLRVSTMDPSWCMVYREQPNIIWRPKMEKLRLFKALLIISSV